MKTGTNHKGTKPRRVLISLCLCAFVVWFMVLARHNFSTFAQIQTEAPSSSNLHQWGAVTLFHGLPSDHVRAIAQDRDGTVLLGTDSGLVRYDGRSVQKIQGFLSRRIWD